MEPRRYSVIERNDLFEDRLLFNQPSFAPGVVPIALNLSPTEFSPALITEIINFFSATNITGAEAETLTDGSDAQSLHSHQFYRQYAFMMS